MCRLIRCPVGPTELFEFCNSTSYSNQLRWQKHWTLKTPSALLQRRLVPRASNMRFKNCDLDRLDFAGVAAECASTCGLGQSIEDIFAQKFGRSVGDFQVR